MGLRYGSRSRPGTMVSTWLNSLVSGTEFSPAGYMGGGTDGSNVDVIRKMDFGTDASSTLTATLSAVAYIVGAMANSGVAGYFGGGRGGDPVATLTTVDKLAFPADSKSTLGTGLSSARQMPTGLGNAGVAGYFAGGETTNTVDKFSFSDDSRTTLGTGLDGVTDTGEGMSNSGTAGYVGAGHVSAACSTAVYKITYSADSMSTLSATLATGMRYGSAMANVGTAGYIAGGYPCADPYLATVNKFSFSDDSRSTLGTGLSQGLYAPAGFALKDTAGYFAGGVCCAGVSWTKQTQAEKFAFADDTRSIVASAFAAGTSQAGGMANEGAF